MCKVTGSRRYSRDLPQGGLEVPCTLKFQGSTKDIDKVKKLLEAAPTTTPVVTPQAPPTKKRKLDSAGTEGEPQRWVQHGEILLSTEDKAGIISGQQQQHGEILLSTEDKAGIISGQQQNDEHIKSF